jgi:hypothetical protein
MGDRTVHGGAPVPRANEFMTRKSRQKRNRYRLRLRRRDQRGHSFLPDGGREVRTYQGSSTNDVDTQESSGV